MDIDWSDAIYDAENSPRAVLAEFGPYLDNIRTLVVIAVQPDVVNRDNFIYRVAGSSIEALGMIEIVRHGILSHLGKDPEAE